MMKIILFLLFIFSAALFSCYQKENKVGFSHVLHLDSTLKIYEFIIQNKSDSDLLIFVPNLYIKKEGSPENEFLLDAVTSRSDIQYFETFNAEDFNQKVLSSSLLSKTKDIEWKEDFKTFTNPRANFPVLLFINSNSKVFYKYKYNRNLPKGKYRIIYDTPDFIAKSKKMNEWKKELKGINKIENYFYTDLITPTDKGIPFEIK